MLINKSPHGARLGNASESVTPNQSLERLFCDFFANDEFIHQ
jgi:hypothetical protein